MTIKDFLPVIVQEFPNIRILSNTNKILNEEYFGSALGTPYKLLDYKINLIRSCGGCFEVYINEEKV